jgi:hypothetical protein
MTFVKYGMAIAFVCAVALTVAHWSAYRTTEAAPQSTATSKDWSIQTTIIEACSCPMFCQCYFNTQPSRHHNHEGQAMHHFCRFNNVFRVTSGNYGNVKLDGAKFWVAGDLGGDFSEGKMDWAELTYDPSVTAEQREAVQAILGRVYPVHWNSFKVVDDGAIDWSYTKDRAEARMDGGKSGEVILKRMPGNTSEPVVIRNLKYWGVPDNEGFVLMPNEVQAYRKGGKPYEFKGTNGFMISFAMSSRDAKK